MTSSGAATSPSKVEAARTHDSVLVELRLWPRGWVDAVAASYAFLERYLILFAIAMAVGATAGQPLLNWIVEQTRWSPEFAGWVEIATRPEAFLVALCLVWMAALVWSLLRTARVVQVCDGELTLLLRSGNRTLALRRSEIHAVEPISSTSMFFRIWWPHFPSRLRSVSLTVTGWYRIRARDRIYYLAQRECAAFEEIVRDRLRIVPGRRPQGVVRSACMLLRTAVAPLVFVAISGLGAGLLALGMGLAAADPEDSGFTSVTLSRLFLARLPQERDGATPPELTPILERALAGGNPDVVRLVVDRGAVAGHFDLFGFDSKNACKRTLAGFAATQPAHNVFDSVVDRSRAAELTEYLTRVEARFRLGDQPDFATLVRVAQCEMDDRRRGEKQHLPLVLYLDALRRGARPMRREEVDLDQVIATSNVELLEFTLNVGADLERPDWIGRTALMRALARARDPLSPQASAQHAVIERLVSAGANVRAKDQVGRAVAYYAAEAGPAYSDLVRRSSPETAGATVLGTTLFHAVAAGGDAVLADELIRQGLSAADRTADGRTPLHFARGAAMVRLLVERGARVTDSDARGQTPLHHAAARGDFEGAQALIDARADREATDIFGNLPYDYAPRAKRSKPAPKGAGAADIEARWAALLSPYADLSLVVTSGAERR